MKRLLALVLAVLMMLTFVACKGNGDDENSSSTPAGTASASGKGFNGGGNTTDTDTSNTGEGEDGEIIPGNNITCTYEDDKSKTTVIFIFEDGKLIEANYNVIYYTEEDAKDNYNFMMLSDDVYYDVELDELNLKYSDTSLVGSTMDEIIEMCEALGEWTRD